LLKIHRRCRQFKPERAARFGWNSFRHTRHAARCPFGRRVHKPGDLPGVTANREEIKGVFDGLTANVRQFNHANGFCDAMKFARHKLRVVVSGLVLVRDDYNVRAA
jgi:hypothetical protein